MFPFSEDVPRVRVLPKRMCRDAKAHGSQPRSSASLFDIIEELKDDDKRERDHSLDLD